MEIETTTELTETVSTVKIQTVRELPSFYHLIALGVAMLTAHYRGLHWVDRIDLGVLNMSSPDYCILGQLFGRFSKGAIQIGVYDDGPIQYGFDTTSDYYLLTRQWKEVLTKLKAERAKVKGKRKPKVAKPTV